jgi:hypothetical protein
MQEQWEDDALHIRAPEQPAVEPMAHDRGTIV